MSMQGSDQRRRRAAEQAAEWLLVMKSGKFTGKERGEFVDWLRESPLHIAEMLRISRVDHALGHGIDWSEIAAIKDEERQNVVTLDDFRHPPMRDESSRASLVRLASAAGFAAMVVLGVWLFVNHNPSVIRTQVGERRELTLADGSVVDVAPSTELRVTLKDRQRLVKLEHGQAFFHVAKDANRPFIVDAGETQVRAVGTAFDVTRSTAGVTVTVVEGRVAVSRERSSLARMNIITQTAPLADVFVSANEQVVVTPEAVAVPVREVNGAAEVAWTDGNLVFNDDTVAEVVRRFNLHNRAQIEILDQTLAARRVSGVFKVSDPESFIAFVRATHNESPDGDATIRLKAAAQ